MADQIQELQKSTKKPTKREEEIVEELYSQDKKSNLKIAGVIGIFSIVLHLPLFRKQIKNFVPIFSNEYYYVVFSGILLFFASYLLIEKY